MRLRWLIVLALLIAACSSGQEQAEPADAGADEPASSTTVTPTEAVEADSTTTTTESPAVPVITDFGVTDTAIRVGLSVDLSGPLADVTAAIVDAHVAWFDEVNASGGIGGRTVEIIALDHASDEATHRDNLVALAEFSENGVVTIGSAGNAELLGPAMDVLDDASLSAIPRTNAQVFFDPTDTVWPFGSSTCVDAMNGVAWLVEQADAEAPTLAILSRPGAYGDEGARGAAAMAEELGVELVLDASGLVEGDSIADLLSAVVDAEPDIIWLATSPSETAQLVGADLGELASQWGGNDPAWAPQILETSVAASFDDRYVSVGPFAPVEVGSPFFDRMRALMPPARHGDLDALAVGWLQASAIDAAIRSAVEAGDLSRAAVGEALSGVSLQNELLQEEIGEPSFSGPLMSSAIRSIQSTDATPSVPLQDEGVRGLRLVERFESTATERLARAGLCG